MIPTTRRVRPTLLARLVLFGALTALPFVLLSSSQAWAQTAAPSGSPLAGNAMWVWYTPKPSRVDAMIAQLKRAHMSSVFIKSADGTTPWPQFNRQLVDRLHSAGIHVCAWHYVYGTHPRTEARVSALAYRAGAECMIIDAETEYEGRPRAAWYYTHELRSLTSSKWTIGLSTFPYLKYHASFPYRVFLRRGAATVNLPQMYWRDIGVSPAKIVRDTYKVNRNLGRPVYPIGQTWNSPGTGELRAFQQAARQAGAKGVSWWDWSQTSRRGWNELQGPDLFKSPIVSATRQVHTHAATHAVTAISKLIGRVANIVPTAMLTKPFVSN